MAHLIKVFEHETLRVNQVKNGVTFKSSHFNSIVKYNEKNKNKFFTVVHNGIKFNQYVGVLQVGKIVIEILPKIDSLNEGNDSLWQSVLFQMLRECKLIKMESFSEAQLKYRYNSILDLYFEEYLKEVNKLIREGLSKKYRSNEGNLTALKGSLKFGQHLSQNSVHRERFYTSHTVYDHEHLMNQILGVGLEVLSKTNNNPILADSIRRTQFHLPDIKLKKITAESFERLKYDRKTKRYKRALEIAKMLILNYSPDITGGSNDLLALLFDMNVLWEEYIFRKIRAVEPSTTRQCSEIFWESDSTRKRIRPDIFIGDKNLVLDTKWKKLTTDKLYDGDLQQMYIYNKYKETRNAVLIYPGFKSEQVMKGNYLEGKSESILLRINPLTEEGKLNKTLGAEIISTIEFNQSSNLMKSDA